MLKKQILISQPGWLDGFRDGIRRFLPSLASAPPTEPFVCEVTREIEAPSLADASNVNGRGTHNQVGTPPRTETNNHADTGAPAIPQNHAGRTAPGATDRAIPLITPAPDVEAARWLNASLLARVAQAAWRVCLHISYRTYFWLSVSGLEHVPAKGPLIIVSNHSSHLDYGALIVALKKRSKTIHSVSARDYFFNTPFRSWASHALLNALPFDRQSHFGECIALPLSVLRHGHSLIYFPEGSRSTSGVIQPFRPGVGLLAVESGVPVLPAFISGTYQSLPKGRRWPRPHRVHVRFGPPVVVRQAAPDESPTQLVGRVTADVQRAVEALSNQTPTPSRRG